MAVNKIHFYLIITILFIQCDKKIEQSESNFETVFETSNGTETPEYNDVIKFYKDLSETFNSVAIYDMQKTDSGQPLHLVTFNPNRTFESEFSRADEKSILLVNNGIHPGESDGIDASMLLIRDLAQGKIETPENTIIAVIPIYNIGGALNRNSTTRTNQNGPKSYGFRGNARNYDLNRDFIKADTKNARAFANLFRIVKPDYFIDNHVSNGADYQYTLTHLFTQHNKLGGQLGNYLHTSLMPKLEDSLAKAQWDITPYVNVFNQSPEKGFTQFLDSPRYSTGYTTLFGTVGMMVETHMLKPYKQRVEGTYELMKQFLKIIDEDVSVVKNLRKIDADRYKVGSYYPIQWRVDSTQTKTLNFKGFEAEMLPSEFTGAQRLKFDRTKPYARDVTYYNTFKAVDSITIPEQYIVPQGYWNVIELLKKNKISYDVIQKDTVITAEVYHIKDYKTRNSPYEGHYLHYNTAVEVSEEEVALKKGDYIFNTQQDGVRYLLETLEPSATDSFFNWNFFDTILQQKEGFSPYVWEDKAVEFLNTNPNIKADFEAKKAAEPDFNANWFAQLDWIHKQSPNYEAAHLRYPIIRVGG
ncbi:MAG TPA: hypothetical protein EYN07_01110 [Flavobacteriaceae bacterium]|nr:hypothetical protein [Flavobacteriaceae bacterium]HBR53722.1 hypothetical protein [Flavobacteriaceae bacterium]HIB48905.1 hypothetical protein [Flavobacteriaceae bacterium]HIN97816.1 hypothetical protein [Flavobacteriaceae bacterium]